MNQELLNRIGEVLKTNFGTELEGYAFNIGIPEPQLEIPTPPSTLFKSAEHVKGQGVAYTMQQEHHKLEVIEKIEYPESGGVRVYHVNKEFPVKGFPFPQAVKSCQLAKRVFMSGLYFFVDKDMIIPLLAFAILPRKLKLKIIRRYLKQYLRVIEIDFEKFYLQDRYMIECALELKKFIEVFLNAVGLDEKTSRRFAMAFSHFIEYDSAYRYRLEDLASETTKEKLKADPVNEVLRILSILKDRDHRASVNEKFNKFGLIFKWGFLFIKKPFYTALESVDFTKFQLDEIDHHTVRNLGGYNFFGKTVEERATLWPIVARQAFEIQ